MSSSKSLAALPLVIVALLVLAGCSAEKPSELTTPDAPPPVPTASQTPTAEPLSFTPPTECSTVVPQSRLDEFEAEGLVLLGGPGGKYPDYLQDATPEEQAGGISCIWGFADSEVSSLTISVAPLSASTRPDIVESFNAQGLNEATSADGTAFTLQGDRTLDPAIINVLRGDSWISVIMTIGGTESYREAELISTEVYASVYK
jgi:hypothetical protein